MITVIVTSVMSVLSFTLGFLIALRLAKKAIQLKLKGSPLDPDDLSMDQIEAMLEVTPDEVLKAWHGEGGDHS